MNFDEKLPDVPSTWTNDRVHLFKYMSFEVAKIVLENRTLRWSSPRTLNDVYDVQFDLSLDVDVTLLRKLVNDKMWSVINGTATAASSNPMGALLPLFAQAENGYSRERLEKDFEGVVEESLSRMKKRLPETREEFRKNLYDLKLLCLSEDPANPPMWAHYAELNAGVVLRLRSTVLFDSPYGMAKPVRYVEQVPSLMDEDEISDFMSGISTTDARPSLDKMVFTKGEAWAYEKEWRVSAGSGRDKEAPFEDIPFHEMELDGIIVGINMKQDARDEIARLSNAYPNVEMLQSVKSRSGLHHDIEPL